MNLCFKSYAKLNLFLHVIEKRLDGYHNISSLFALLNLHDSIYIKKVPDYARKVQIFTHKSEELRIENNIAYKVMDALSSYTTKPISVCIKIFKRIPIGAGLGGGSSNAATILLALNQMYNLQLSLENLLDIGVSLGADIPFFLHQCKLALVSGIGEKVVPVTQKMRKTLYILLILPKIHINTKKVYENLSNADYTGYKCKEGSLYDQICCGKNDLTNSAIGLEPSIAVILSILLTQARCINARMSGSGSSCFGIFASLEDANSAMTICLAELQAIACSMRIEIMEI